MVRHGKTTRYDTGDALAFMENWDRSGTSPEEQTLLYRLVSRCIWACKTCAPTLHRHWIKTGPYAIWPCASSRFESLWPLTKVSSYLVSMIKDICIYIYIHRSLKKSHTNIQHRLSVNIYIYISRLCKSCEHHFYETCVINHNQTIFLDSKLAS